MRSYELTPGRTFGFDHGDDFFETLTTFCTANNVRALIRQDSWSPGVAEFDPNAVEIRPDSHGVELGDTMAQGAELFEAIT